MNSIIFFVNTVLAYGLLFVLMYFQLRYFSKYKDANPSNIILKRSIVLGVIAIFLMAIVDISSIQNISDGRYVILFLSVMYYDILTSWIPLLMINGYILMTMPGNIFSSFMSTIIVVLITSVYKQWFHKSDRYYSRIAVFSLILGFSTIMITVFIGNPTPYYQTLKSNVLISLILFSGINTLITYLFDKETDHQKMIENLRVTRDELEMQNHEVRSLYDDVRAKEKNIKENFEMLNDYRWKLETSEKRYERVMKASREGFFDYYPITKVWVISDRFCELLDYKSSDANVLSRKIFEHMPLEYRNLEMYFQNGNIWPESQMISFEIQMETKSGIVKWFLFSAMADIENNNKLVRITGSLLDIHQRKLEQEKVAFYAFHDPLTGFLNKDYFVETIRKYLFTSNDNLMIVNVAIAHYDKLVDIYGDKLLTIAQYQLGNDILDKFKDFAIVSVLKSGSFGVLILQKNKYLNCIKVHVESLEKKYNKVQRFLNIDLELPLVFPYDEYKPKDTAEMMLDRLDITRAYCEEMHVYGELAPFKWEYYNRKTFEKELSYYLRTALTEALFEVYYQPKYKCEGDRSIIVGIEALVRLSHPRYGMVPPDVFIKLAESIGEIHNIDKMVMTKVIEYAKVLKKLHRQSLEIAVNVSFIDLMNSDYIKWIIEELEVCRNEGINIVLEITETAIAKYFEGVEENLKRLSEVGIEIHLDDFGTGYSSLSHLVKLPVNTLKIDRTFITEMIENNRMKEIVKTIVNLGNELHLKVIAEGVETREQLELLKSMACHYYQGYYFSKPLPAEELSALIEKHAPLSENV